MKRIMMIGLLTAVIALPSQAQELKKVMLFLQTGKLADAKTEIDKNAADPKFSGKAETYYWKSRIYAAIYKDPVFRAKTPNAKEIAEEAFAKYQQLDSNFTFVKDMMPEGPNGYFDMYQTCFAEGVRNFNGKRWDSAAYYFSSTVRTYDLIYKNKWTSAKTPFDTTSILYLGYAFQNAQKPAEAVQQYTRLEDNKVTDSSYIDMYRFTLNHFITTKDEAQFKKYLAVSKEAYPTEQWDDYEMEYLDKNLNLAEKTALYDKESAAGTLNEFKYLQFGDWFANVRTKEKDMDSTQHSLYNLKAADAYQKAYGLNNKNAIAAFNAGLIYYNNFADYSDKYSDNRRALQQLNANKPPADKDPKKRSAQDAKFNEQADAIKKLNTDLEKPINESVEVSLSFLEKSFNILKGRSDLNKTEKVVYERNMDYIANMYEYKRDKVRGKDMKLFDFYDSKYKEFDSRVFTSATGDNQNNQNDLRNYNNSNVVSLKKSGGVFKVEIKINGVLTIDGIFDTGASDVTLPPEVALTLIRTGTITNLDYLGKQSYKFADGSSATSSVFNIKEIEIGGKKLFNIRASIANSVDAPILLGQSLLSKLGKYTIDNQKGLLIFQ